MSCHDVSYRVVSRRISSCRFASYSIVPCRIASYYLMKAVPLLLVESPPGSGLLRAHAQLCSTTGRPFPLRRPWLPVNTARSPRSKRLETFPTVQPFCPKNWKEVWEKRKRKKGRFEALGWRLLTHSLSRVINVKFLLQPHQEYSITQYEELGCS